MRNLFNYISRKSPIHDLTGATKLVCLLLWSFASMMTYDTRILIVMPFLAFGLFPLSKIKLRDVSFMLAFTLSLYDFVITHFTKGPGFDTISTKVYAEVRKGIRPEMYALSTLLFVGILVLILLLGRGGKKKSMTQTLLGGV